MFKPTIGSENLHQDSNYNGVRIVNSATSENMFAKSTLQIVLGVAGLRTSSSKYIRTAFFWVITHRVVPISCR